MWSSAASGNLWAALVLRRSVWRLFTEAAAVGSFFGKYQVNTLALQNRTAYRKSEALETCKTDKTQGILGRNKFILAVCNDRK